MKILIVSGFFYPQNTPRAFRTTELAKELVRQGHDVTIYFPENKFDYSDFRQVYPSTLKQFPTIEERRTFIGISLVDRIIFRLLHQFFWYPDPLNIKNVKHAIKNERQYDLLISIAVPHYIHWAIGKLYKKGIKAAKTWIADCGDPFMLTESSNYRPPFYFKPLETRWCRYCDYITVPTDTSYLGYYPEFYKKIKIIPQGFDFSAIKMPEYTPNGIPTFAFAGSFIPGSRDPQKLFEFLSSIKEPFKFIIYGTSNRNQWSSVLSKLEGKVVFEKPIPRDELLPILAQMDFLINIGNGTNVQTPSKLIDYTLTKRPILTIETNDIKEHILKEFLEGNYEHQDAVIDISKYDIHNVAQQFLDLYGK